MKTTGMSTYLCILVRLEKKSCEGCVSKQTGFEAKK